MEKAAWTEEPVGRLEGGVKFKGIWETRVHLSRLSYRPGRNRDSRLHSGTVLSPNIFSWGWKIHLRAFDSSGPGGAAIKMQIPPEGHLSPCQPVWSGMGFIFPVMGWTRDGGGGRVPESRAADPEALILPGPSPSSQFPEGRPPTTNWLWRNRHGRFWANPSWSRGRKSGGT